MSSWGGSEVRPVSHSTRPFEDSTHPFENSTCHFEHTTRPFDYEQDLRLVVRLWAALAALGLWG